MGMLAGGFYSISQGVAYTVALGSDRTETDLDTAAPPDSRSGYRIVADTLKQETGNSPAFGGGPISTWVEDEASVTPTGFNASNFECKWDQISNTANARNFPVAEATYVDLGAVTRTWYASMTTEATGSWVFDVTVREKADTGNTDVVRITLNVTGNTA